MVTPNPLEQAIFHAARRIAAPEARRQFLEQACRADPALQARVEALLRVHDAEQSFLRPAAGESQATLAESLREEPGTVVGPYKLLQQLGEGGMGAVFLAEQERPVRRKVALKVIKPGMDTGDVLARFEAERQALALMDHPHIAKVLDAGTTDAGRPYFVMELVKGAPITRYCDERRLTPKERLELFVPVCQAVQHAHQKGVIHRDLKPSNVLVALYDGKPVPEVIDFGVAKAIGPRLTERTLFTEFGQVVGTLEYMSPEQAQLNQLDVDTRSDIYALGVLLYELLTGATPLGHLRATEAPLLEALRIIREEEPAAPSKCLSTTEELPAVAANRGLEPRKLSALVRGELDWIVMKCLEKDRDRRYETANGLAQDLQRYLRDEPVLACPPTLRYRLGKFLRKHRGPVAAAALVGLALVGGIAATTAAYLQARAAERQAREAEAEARATADFLTYDMMALAPEGAGADRNASLGDALDVAAPEIDRSLGRRPRVEAAVRHVLGTAYRFLGEYEKARPQLERAVALRRRELGADDPSTLSSQHNLCTVLDAQGQLVEAEALARHVLDARRKQLPPGHVHIASSLALLGLILTEKHQPDQAEPFLREALDIFSRALPEGHWRTANAQSLLGGCLSAQGRYADAEPLLLAACRTFQTAGRGPRHHTRRALEQVVRLYEAWGKKDQADQWRRKLREQGTGASAESQSAHEGAQVPE